ncbi:hypothetical protein [Halobacteriovorax sp. CON-3]|uniref:hypothetical protein n=1 Tax=Halobacteriovorax sp. CON-3 TaxID=3157710 RepID=UPI003718CA3D
MSLVPLLLITLSCGGNKAENRKEKVLNEIKDVQIHNSYTTNLFKYYKNIKFINNDLLLDETIPSNPIVAIDMELSIRNIEEKREVDTNNFIEGMMQLKLDYHADCYPYGVTQCSFSNSSVYLPLDHSLVKKRGDVKKYIKIFIDGAEINNYSLDVFQSENGNTIQRIVLKNMNNKSDSFNLRVEAQGLKSVISNPLTVLRNSEDAYILESTRRDTWIYGLDDELSDEITYNAMNERMLLSEKIGAKAFSDIKIVAPSNIEIKEDGTLRMWIKSGKKEE